MRLFNKKIYSLGAMMLCLIFTACQKDFFDQIPDDRITIEDVFNRRDESERYLANIYAHIRQEGNQASGSPWIGAADEGDMTYNWDGHASHFMNIGMWDANSNLAEFWSGYYRGIRSASYFIEHIGQNEEILRLPNGQQLINQYIAEARFLRAWFYFCVLRQYGPMVIVREIIPPDLPMDELQLERSPYDDCVAYIAQELDEAAGVLPLRHANASADMGRATSAMCLAAKARLLLYAASPLNNGNTDYANFANQDGTVLYNQSYDIEKWRLAADAAKAVIDLNAFSLYKEYNEDGSLNPLLSYQNAFIEPFNVEQIFMRPNWDYGSWDVANTPRFAGGWSAMGATQHQVDAYFMANGKTIDEEGSGYIETGFSEENDQYTRSGTYNMFVNREPRFYASIVYSGSLWINKEEGDRVIEMHRYGNNGMEGQYNYSKTGYIVRKFVHPNANPRIGREIRRPYVMIRLGEIYLNYAEALNEYDPGNPDILRYLNLIRERAGIPGIEPGLGQEEMREKIRRERRVELAFETLRYFDTRRWKVSMETDRGPFYGLNVEAGNSLTDTEFYQRTVFENRVFHPNYYLFPIPQSEIDRGRLIVQNPGW
ncbi:RagB/SusD family nutrient uptake outer membrane protein [Olivibacter sp. SDN3]|uniref:RagB/SusD family nutrient uptake outer membrane protein n=1 Tax=Olivibacter sp. SDN3 TaxID=2764720 RepID=UPI00165108EC|nr:RagB/SusD family nutrient uptake outer membrane protein [Olivibacter sp. SDN3]QNL49559.1 RagB/SusD family nutrient uptake outer membrane protein [Olivibacter sp. SDN3]